jgi:hypothetical protein
MRHNLLFSLFAGLAAALPAIDATAADIGVSVNVGQPGFYGRIDIGNASPPVIYAQPLIIAPAPVAVMQRPIYLRVPPGHEKNWSKHCARYAACGQQTYFVREDWYSSVYAPARGLPYRDPPHRAYAPVYAPVYREVGPHGARHGHGYSSSRGNGHGKDHREGNGKGHRN